VVTLGSQKKSARLPAGDDRATTSPGTVELPPAFAGNEKGLPDKVFQLRKKLYIKASLQPKVRFYTLFGLVLRRDVLEAAWDQVARNHGGPGVDGVRIEDVRHGHGGVDGFLDKIEASLRSRSYKPQAVKRVMIPNANGGERPLGIPTVRDRVVQTAVKLILEPIFEADFLDCSYGFRPKRSALGALRAIKEALEAGYVAVYDADLKGYFDTIPHAKLMACVEQRVADGSVLKLIRQFLRAPVLEEPKDRHHPPRKVWPRTGTPQGGVISPLLANLYLHWLDKRFHARSGPGHADKARLVRYADDFVILARYLGPQMVSWVEATVEGWMGCG